MAPDDRNTDRKPFAPTPPVSIHFGWRRSPVPVGPFSDLPPALAAVGAAPTPPTAVAPDILRAVSGTLPVWIAEDVSWLLTHGITDDPHVAFNRERAADEAFCRARSDLDDRDCLVGCVCSLCFELTVVSQQVGSAMRDANRFRMGDSPSNAFGDHLFGNRKRPTTGDLLVLLKDLLAAGVSVARRSDQAS